MFGIVGFFMLYPYIMFFIMIGIRTLSEKFEN